jgi:hypothetical protein
MGRLLWDCNKKMFHLGHDVKLFPVKIVTMTMLKPIYHIT